MNFTVKESSGFEDDCILSIRCGGVRKQTNLSLQKPLGFPTPASQSAPSALKVDVLRPAGSAEVSVAASEEDVTVRFPTAPGLPAKALTLQVGHNGQDPFSRPATGLTSMSAFGGTMGSLGRPNTSGEFKSLISPRSEKSQAAVAAAQSYMDKFGIMGSLQGLLCKLLRDKPDDPFAFMAAEVSSLSTGSKAEAEEALATPPSATPQPPEPEVPREKKNQKAEQCVNCGNIFMHDAVFCRRCGHSREQKVPEKIVVATRMVLNHVWKTTDSTSWYKSRLDRLDAQNKRLADEADRIERKIFALGQKPPAEEGDGTDPMAAAPSMTAKGSSEYAKQLHRRLQNMLVFHDRLRLRVTHLSMSLASIAEAALQKAKDETLAAVRIARGDHPDYSRPHSRQDNPALPSNNSFSPRKSKKHHDNAVADRPAVFLSMNYSAEDEDDEDEYEEDEEEKQEQEMLAKSFKEFSRKRGKAVSAEAYGAWNNRRAAFVPPVYKKSSEAADACMQAFLNCPLFAHISKDILTTVVKAMPLSEHSPGECILKQGQEGDSLFVIVTGCVECFDDRTGHKFICKFQPGRIFGELAMLYSVPRSLSVHCASEDGCTLARLNRSVYQNLIVRHQMRGRERWEECLRQARMLETLNSAQVASLCDILETRTYEEGQKIVEQGEPGDEFFIVMAGECAATVETVSAKEGQSDVQEHRRYHPGDLFGERALLTRTTRAATVSAIQPTEVLCLSRSKFERMLGPLNLLQRQNYTADPRKSIADFYKSGDLRGPAGSCKRAESSWHTDKIVEAERTNWFAVYRPTSRAAIAKMLSGAAVGKGLNVKGKSAKRGRQSGFVPFLQISQNSDKEILAPPVLDARVKIFFHSDEERTRMLDHFETYLDPLTGVHIAGDRVIDYIDMYAGSYGLEIPEPVLREVYINKPDITFQAGWDTGRKSEPAFMDMNFAAVRGSTEPKIVLFQSDKQDPLNPHGLLLAYAEQAVKPVVSDFDTFLVGQQNMAFKPLAEEQVAMEQWALKHTEEILEKPGPASWTTRWLEVIQKSAQQGYKPVMPKFGFGDAISYRLIEEAVQATKETGAIRHGAECFNYYFPQELDEEYLVVWEGFREEEDKKGLKGKRLSVAMAGQADGFHEKSWEYLDEDELRDFLMARIEEGYVFPINPVWPVRDHGWTEVLQAMRSTAEGRKALACYFPNSSGILEKLEELMERFPEGFCRNIGGGGSLSQRKSALLDLDQGERADLLFTKLLSDETRGGINEDEEEGDGADTEAPGFQSRGAGDTPAFQ